MTEITPVTTRAWRRFLLSDEGKTGMLYLREKVPAIGRGQPHEVQFDAGFTQGYLHALNIISEIIAVRQDNDVRADND